MSNLFSVLHQKVKVFLNNPDPDAEKGDPRPSVDLEFGHNPEDITEHHVLVHVPDHGAAKVVFNKHGAIKSQEFIPAPGREARGDRDFGDARVKPADPRKAPRNSEGGEQSGGDVNTSRDSGVDRV